MRGKGFWKRILSVVLIIGLILPILPADILAANSKTIKLHFRNDANWSSVYAYAWNDAGYIKQWPGTLLSKGTEYNGYYTYTIDNYTQDYLNFIFNDGGSNQSADLYADVSSSYEWWVIPVETGGERNWVVTDKPLCSPIVDGYEVTFNYISGLASYVDVRGSLNGWTGGKNIMSESNDVFSTTVRLDAGKYTYKFYVENEGATEGFWVSDPQNDVTDGTNDRNSVLVVSGFKGLGDLSCLKGESITLPSTLDYVNASGTEYASTTATYTLEETSGYVSLEGNVLTVDEEYPGGSVRLKVTGTKSGSTYTSTCDVTLTENYTIYAHSAVDGRNTLAAAGLHIWDSSGETTLEPLEAAFATTEVLSDGRTWLKAELELPAAEKLGFILKSKGTNVWDWQTKNLYYTDRSGIDNTLYILDGYTEIFTSVESAPEDHYVYIEYTRADASYSDTWAYVWNNGWSYVVDGIEQGYNWSFENVNGEYIAKVPVAMGETDKTIGFIVQKGTDWTGKDGGDNYLSVPAGQKYVKVRFSDGGITYRLPYSAGREINRKNDTISFYYRDDMFFDNNKLDELGDVQLVLITQNEEGTSEKQTLDMQYDAKDERYVYSMELREETDYYYYYLVNGNKVLDAYSKKSVQLEGETYSLCRNKYYDVVLEATLLNDSMHSDENNVLSLSWSAKSGDEADLEGFSIESVYADLSELGLGSKVEMNTELMELSFGCLGAVESGEKTIGITVTDDCDMTYTTTVKVTIEEREKTENTTNKLGDFDWDEAVIYFAVTDRFFDGNNDNNDGVLGNGNTSTGSTNPLGIHGGDLAGVKAKLDYLYNLGVNTIWLTPIVDNIDEATDGANQHYAYHGYWAEDFTKLNPHLGTEEELKALVDAAHEKGMKIMIDVVLNHAGYGAEDNFNTIIPTDAVDGSGNPIFKDMIRDENNIVSGDEKQDSLSGLPDFVTEDPEVRAKLIEWQTTWMKDYGIDYYRVDTVKHVDETTWESFKNELTKINSEFKLIGEYYGAGTYNDCDQLDTGKMDAILDFNFNDIMENLASENLTAIEEALFMRNSLLTNTATMGSFLSSHDEDGFLYTLINKYGESADWAEALMKVAATYQITAKGQPVIYYGEELGLSGANNYPSQDNRYDFDWTMQVSQSQDMTSMYNHYKTMLNIRRDYSAVFAKGDRTKVVLANTYNSEGTKEEQGYSVFARHYDGTTIYVGTNVWGAAKTATFYVNGAPGSKYTDLYSNETYTVSEYGTITVSIPSANKGGTAVLVQTEGTTVNVKDNNTVTVKIHYHRSDNNYTNWNAYLWGDTFGGKGHEFETVNGEKVATIQVDGRTTNEIFFRIRLGDWKGNDHNGQDQSFDISDVVSGTVHFYIESGVWGGVRVLGADAVVDTAVVQASYDRVVNKIYVEMNAPVKGNLEDAFEIKCASSGERLTITDVVENGNTYTITLDEDISELEELLKAYTVTFDSYTYSISMPNVYSSAEFENKYAYDGEDLGLTYSEEQSIFKVWAPTADAMKLNVYTSGTKGANDLIESYTMTKGEKGVWEYTLTGDWSGKYYTYTVTVNNKTSEVCDPYARTTGVNGNRAMIIDLDATDPEGWDTDKGPHADMDYTDAIIYELHIRDLSSDSSSGVSKEHQGKFLGLTETGTTTEGGEYTALDHMIDLGITHLHILPMYDYASVDETRLDEAQFNWGYDPLNYNVPEGSYSTDPYNGETRVEELKEMVQTLHENNINVVMDVVYNHVYDAGTFGFNVLVPKYFSRTNADGSYSNGSGCGNDTASERAMVHKYIVESILYWHEEYHIDGFRFDLVGLLDAVTINTIVNEVHKIDPDIIFYGEGWTMNTAVSKDGYDMATQWNSQKTPGFAYFSDTIRNGIAGSDTNGQGFIWGTNDETLLTKCFKGAPDWCKTPSQTINYVSCHDNYTLMDKINVVSKSSYNSYDDMPGDKQVKLNNLSAAMYMFAQGIPLVHAGEEFLRTKLDESGNVIHNSYNASDFVNKLRWYNLDTEIYADTVDYYEGLIEFRKNHEALRLDTATQVNSNVKSHWVADSAVLYYINGKSGVSGEVADGIIVIYNASANALPVNFYGSDGNKQAYNIPQGTWKICVNDKDAGTDVLATVTNGQVTVPAYSAMVLVKGETVDKDSVYTQNNRVTIRFEQSNVTVKTNGKTTLEPTLSTPCTLLWESSNEQVAKVVDGKVTGVSAGTATITATTLHGVSTTCTVTVSSEIAEPEVPEELTSNKVTVAKDTVSKITAGTTVSKILDSFNEECEIKVTKNGKEVSANSAIGTGMLVSIMDGTKVVKSYTVVVTGDVNGDGSISITDMLAIKSQLLGKSKLTGAFAKAADTSGDNAMSITDFIQLKAKLLGKGEITAR